MDAPWQYQDQSRGGGGVFVCVLMLIFECPLGRRGGGRGQGPWPSSCTVCALCVHCVHTTHAEAGILTQEYLSPV